jgi:hypothetical protein
MPTNSQNHHALQLREAEQYVQGTFTSKSRKNQLLNRRQMYRIVMQAEDLSYSLV